MRNMKSTIFLKLECTVNAGECRYRYTDIRKDTLMTFNAYTTKISEVR